MKVATQKKIVWITAAVVAFIILLLVGVISYVGLSEKDDTSFDKLENLDTALSSIVYAEDGTVLTKFSAKENRTNVSYEELSPYLEQALVATEDRRFYDHSGIDFKSLPRVAIKTILMRDQAQGGGSTITNQLAKKIYKRPRMKGLTKYKVKIREGLIALKLERCYTKKEIITMYLNVNDFGDLAYGINAAANTFFGKSPLELNIQESATLVGMLNKTTRYNPYLHPEASKNRRNHVLSKMQEAGYITKAECDSICQLPIELNYSVQDHNAGHAQYFRDMIKATMNQNEPVRSKYATVEEYRKDSLAWANDELYGWLKRHKKSDGSSYDLNRDGLRIRTTINYKMQCYAEEAVAEHLGKDLQVAFDKECKGNPKRPYAANTDSKIVNAQLASARKNSDRYRNMSKRGVSEREILASFEQKTKMRVFAWNDAGYIDTEMTPMDSIKYYKSILRAAFMVIEPGTGKVKAYVGGPNYRYFPFDNIRQSERQIGSTAKPFLYTLAMQEGMTPCDRVVNVPQTFDLGTGNTWTPRSTDKDEWIGQSVTLKWGLMKSSNNISAYLMKRFGPFAMVDMMRNMGITSRLDAVPSLCVGSCDLSLDEVVAAYNVFPSGGEYVTPILVTSIEDKYGNTIASFRTHKREVISEESAYLMENLMSGVVDKGTGARLRGKYALKGAIAGKTGTNNDHADGWFIGYTPRITAGVWVGGEDRDIHFKNIAQGGASNMALPIWGIFMQKCVKDKSLGFSPEDTFVAPAGFDVNLDCGEDIMSVTETVPQETEGEESYFD